MDWRDEGILLQSRRHAENSAIVEIFTAEHGRHAGVVRGATSRRMAPVLQPGNQVACDWRARLEEHIGSYRIEPLSSRAALLMQDRLALTALTAICGLLSFALPERQAHPRLYTATIDLLDRLVNGAWPEAYLAWELLLLEELGFGLDLQRCAVTGSDQNLRYVSPRSGRAVSEGAAGQWADRLLPMPGASPVEKGLRTTGYFLENWLASSIGAQSLPEARGRLVSLLLRETRKRG